MRPPFVSQAPANQRARRVGTAAEPRGRFDSPASTQVLVTRTRQIGEHMPLWQASLSKQVIDI